MTRRRATVVVAILALLSCALGPGPVAASSAVPVKVPTAHHVRSVPGDGVLYYPSVAGSSTRLDLPHFCSASVVHSATRDLVVTAAHCVFGFGPGIEFVPELHGKVVPHGVWTVTRIFVDPRWTASFDPRHDVAFLRVAPNGGRRLEDVVPGRPLGTPRARRDVRVTGYPMGRGGTPLTCVTPLRLVQGYSGVDCAGFGDGTSGGPWVQRGHVVGVIGGLEQGGCSPDVEYSTPFGAAVRALYHRAETSRVGDVVPVGFTANACPGEL